MTSGFEETVLKKLDELSAGQAELKGDVGTLKSDVGTLRSDVGTLKSDMETLKGDVRRLEVLHEETAEKIDQIIEVVSPVIERNNEQDLTIADHEARIARLESAV